jgi:hypothetical protein
VYFIFPPQFGSILGSQDAHTLLCVVWKEQRLLFAPTSEGVETGILRESARRSQPSTTSRTVLFSFGSTVSRIKNCGSGIPRIIVGVRSLAFATGSYLSIATTGAMFAGGLVRLLVEATTKKKDESEASPGALYSSGLIAAGGVFGLLGIIINLFQDPEISNNVPHWLIATLRLPWRPDLFAFGPKILGPLATNSLFGVFMFLMLAGSLFYFARKKLD